MLSLHCCHGSVSFSSPENVEKNEDSTHFYEDVDVGKEHGEASNVVEEFPVLDVFSWLASPDWFHDNDPKYVHADC